MPKLKSKFVQSSRVLVVVLAATTSLAMLFHKSCTYLRDHNYDAAINNAARAHNIPPELIRAVIRQESRFDHKCVGKAGEIGLMQLTKGAAADWSAATGKPKLRKHQLFNPEINIDVGTWYLSRARTYWSAKPDPLPYALAEYNAGRSNALRWSKNDKNDPNIFWHNITYPVTKNYVRVILQDYRKQIGSKNPG